MSRPITQSQLDILEDAIDKVFARIGIDVEFTRHFLDRLNDKRNQQQITMRELAELFKKEYVRWGKDIAKMDDDAQAVMKDLSSALNVPFALNKNGKEKELVAKTIMRKKDFKTPNRELPVESADLGENYRPGVTVLTREISFNDHPNDPSVSGRDDYETVKRIRWPYGIDVKFDDRTRSVRFKTAKMKTVARLLDKHIDFGAISADEALDLPPELMRFESTDGAKKGSQVKGSEPMPKKQKAGKGPNSPHPMRGRLVGENATTDTDYVRDFIKWQRREGWSVYASRINHNTERAHRLEFEKDGVSFEVIGNGNNWELFADGPTLSGRGEQFDGLDAAFQTGTYNKRPITVDQVREAWEQYQLDEKLPTPRERFVNSAFDELEQKIQQDRDRQSLQGYVFDLYREFNLDELMPASEFVDLYRATKGAAIVEQGFMSEEQYWADE